MSRNQKKVSGRRYGNKCVRTLGEYDREQLLWLTKIVRKSAYCEYQAKSPPPNGSKTRVKGERFTHGPVWSARISHGPILTERREVKVNPRREVRFFQREFEIGCFLPLHRDILMTKFSSIFFLR